MKTADKIFNKRKLSVILSAGVITSLLCVSGITAEPIPLQGPVPFNLYDNDANGYISEDEFLSIRNQRMAKSAARGYPLRAVTSEPVFDQFDMDKDALLSAEELARGQQLQMQQRRNMMRQSRGTGMAVKQGHDSRICRARNILRLEDFDRNKDGLISADEFSREQLQIQKQWDMLRPSSDQGTVMSQGQGSGMSGHRKLPGFVDFDGNKDGYISEQELFEARSVVEEKTAF